MAQGPTQRWNYSIHNSFWSLASELPSRIPLKTALFEGWTIIVTSRATLFPWGFQSLWLPQGPRHRKRQQSRLGSNALSLDHLGNLLERVTWSPPYKDQICPERFCVIWWGSLSWEPAKPESKSRVSGSVFSLSCGVDALCKGHLWAF